MLKAGLLNWLRRIRFGARWQGLSEALHLEGSRALLAVQALLLIALLLPAVNLKRDSWTCLVIFDITQSMDVQDYSLDGMPVSRLDYARDALRVTLRDLPCGSRVGLGAFAEYRSLVLIAPIEVCSGYDDLVRAIGRIDGRMRWANSSQITKGVFWSIRAAKQLGEHPAVIFITDGQEAPPLEVEGQALFEDIKPGEIHGALLGAGGDVPQPIPRSDRDGHPLGYWRAEEVVQAASAAAGGTAHEQLSSVREAHLQALARQVGFDYARLAGSDSLRTVLRAPDRVERRPIATDLAWIPALLALLLFAAQFGRGWIALRRT